MGYHISYENGGSKRTNLDDFVKRKSRGVGWIFLISAALALIVFLQNGKIRQMLLPGDAEVTEAAVQNLVTSVRNGNGVSESVTAFCREIIENGQ